MTVTSVSNNHSLRLQTSFASQGTAGLTTASQSEEDDSNDDPVSPLPDKRRSGAYPFPKGSREQRMSYPSQASKESDRPDFWGNFPVVEALARVFTLATALGTVFTDLDKVLESVFGNTPIGKWLRERRDDMTRHAVSGFVETGMKEISPDVRRHIAEVLTTHSLDEAQEALIDALANHSDHADPSDVEAAKVWLRQNLRISQAIKEALAGKLTEERFLELVKLVPPEQLQALKENCIANGLGWPDGPEEIRSFVKMVFADKGPALSPLLKGLQSLPGVDANRFIIDLAGQTPDGARAMLARGKQRGFNKGLMFVISLLGLDLTVQGSIHLFQSQQEKRAKREGTDDADADEFVTVADGPLDYIESILATGASAAVFRHFAKGLPSKPKNAVTAIGAGFGLFASELLLHLTNWTYNVVAEPLGLNKKDPGPVLQTSLQLGIGGVLLGLLHLKGTVAKLAKYVLSIDNVGIRGPANLLSWVLAAPSFLVTALAIKKTGIKPDEKAMQAALRPQLFGPALKNQESIDNFLNTVFNPIKEAKPTAGKLWQLAANGLHLALAGAPNLARTVKDAPGGRPHWSKLSLGFVQDIAAKNLAWGLLLGAGLVAISPLVLAVNAVRAWVGSLFSTDDGEPQGTPA